MDKALGGDGQAALQMAEESSRTQSPEIAENWYRIAAENGNAKGLLAYAKILILGSRHRQDCIRATFWLERATAAGESSAANLATALRTNLSEASSYESGCKGAR